MGRDLRRVQEGERNKVRIRDLDGRERDTESLPKWAATLFAVAYGDMERVHRTLQEAVSIIEDKRRRLIPEVKRDAKP